MMRDNRTTLEPELVKYASAAATANSGASDAVDCLGADAVGFFAEVTEATGLTSLTMKLTECDTVGGTYTDVAAAHTIAENDGDTTVALTATGKANIGYCGKKRYVKAYITLVATDVDYNVVAVRSALAFTSRAVSIPA